MKTVIIADNHSIADLIAQEHKLRRWQWRYAHSYEYLQGLSNCTILVQSEWHEAPVYYEWTDDEGGIHPSYRFPMREQLHILSTLGNCDIVVVVT